MSNTPSPLSEEQVEHFYREGYVVVPGLVPPDAVASVLENVPTQACEGTGWTAQTFHHVNPTQNAPLHALLTEPRLTGAVRQIFANEPRILYGMLAIVPPHGGKGLPWHQDNQYSLVLGGALNVFVALCDITSDKAILWVAPRSHQMGTQPSKDSEDYGKGHREAAEEPKNGMPLPTMHTGDVCIFDRNTYHRSLKNDTDEPRYAYAAQFQAENARCADTGRIDTPDITPRPRVSELRALWQGK